MVRDQDQVVMYAPPSRLRQYELFLIDEGSQIDDPVAIRLRMALSELPHRHVLMVAADYRQLQPIEGGGHMLHWCLEMEQHFLKTAHCTDDPRLLLFLQTIRKDEPTRDFLRSFWENYVLPPDLELAVRCSRRLQELRGQHFMWLCVTNSGANKINDMALKVEGVTDEERKYGYDGDENAKAGKMFIRPGLMICLTRNLDKTRGVRERCSGGGAARIVRNPWKRRVGVFCEADDWCYDPGTSNPSGRKSVPAMLLRLRHNYSAIPRFEFALGRTMV